jgi:hypothetical protein
MRATARPTCGRSSTKTRERPRLRTDTPHQCVQKRSLAGGVSIQILVDTAVDGNVGAGGEAAQVGCQEQRRIRDLFCRAVAGQRDGADLVVLELLCSVRAGEQHLGEIVDPGRLRRAGADHIDANLTVPQLTCPRAGERPQRRLDRRVHPDAVAALGVRVRRVEDDRATVIEQRQRLLHGEHHALEVDVQLIVQMLLGDVADPCDVDHRRVREHHVKAPTAVGDRGVEPVEILCLAHVPLHAGDVIADFLDR